MKELYREAMKARINAQVPYSKLHVGAAIRCSDGSVYTGCNIENSSFGATICAERTAAVKAISEGHCDFEAIAICCDEGAAWPCGICRQFLYDFAPDMTVITGNDENSLESYTLRELMPKGWEF
ncbi:MAG: cytidine deaminase [Anaerovoracaceae bacterium]|jgi:cytidine deaminase